MEYITIQAEKVHEAYHLIHEKRLQNCLNRFYPGSGTYQLLLSINGDGSITYCSDIVEKIWHIRMSYNETRAHDEIIVYAPIVLDCSELLYLCKMLPARGRVRIPVLRDDHFPILQENGYPDRTLSFEWIDGILRHDSGKYVYADILAMCAMLQENTNLDGVFESLIYSHLSIKEAIRRIKRDGLYAACVYSHEVYKKFIRKNKLHDVRGRGWHARITELEAGRWSIPYCNLAIIYNEDEDYEWDESFYGENGIRQFKKKIRTLQYQDLAHEVH